MTKEQSDPYKSHSNSEELLAGWTEWKEEGGSDPESSLGFQASSRHMLRVYVVSSCVCLC